MQPDEHRMSNQWFRSWHGAPTDPKWLGIARKAGVAPGIVAAVVWALLDRASQASERGSIAGYDADGLACFMGCEVEQIEQIIALMHDKGILAENLFTGWEKHQPKREDNSTDRVKEHRERKRTQVNAGVTQCNAVKRAETLDTDKDTEEECVKEARTHTQDISQNEAVQDLLDNHAGELNDWEQKFLISIKWTESLSKTQRDTLKGIQGKVAPKTGKPYALPTVTRGTPSYDAWIAYYRRQSKTGKTFHENRESFTVPSEYPPEEKAA
jgi:hypothetical protein